MSSNASYVVDSFVQAAPPAPPALPPPDRLPVGTILTLRMRGHTRTAGLEYFAPAIVLNQHPATQMGGGEIEAIVFDPTAGTHYQSAYAIRDVTSAGEGNERHLVVKQSNVGAVLFDPERFESLGELVDVLKERNSRALHALEQRVSAIELAMTTPSNAPESKASTASGATQATTAAAPKAPAKG